MLWQVDGVDAGFDHSASAILDGQTLGPFAAGQTIKVKTLAENSVGKTEGAVKTVTV